MKASTKDKVIIELKNQNIKLNAKIIKIKGKHDQDLLKAKIKFDAMKLEIKKLKSHVKANVYKKIVVLEAKVAYAKVAYDNVNNDNVVMH